MSRADTARCSYSMARDEIMVRIRLRDHVLVLYLGAAATVFGLNLTGLTEKLLLLLPFLTLGATVIVCQHHAIIGALLLFISKELWPIFQEEQEDTPLWDFSKTRREFSNRDIWLRLIGHLCLLILPSIVALWLNRQLGFDKPFPEGPLWWLSFLALITAIIVLISTHSWRKDFLRNTAWID